MRGATPRQYPEHGATTATNLGGEGKRFGAEAARFDTFQQCGDLLSLVF